MTLLDERAVFERTGVRTGGALAPVDGRGLRPALFARFHDLARLRYDFPVVLAAGGAVRTLSGAVDAALRDLAPRGAAGERMRAAALRVEREVRAAAGRGAGGALSDAWTSAAARACADPGARADALRAGAALGIDGELLDCDAGMPARLVTHVWLAANDARARAMRARIDLLSARLSDLARADALRSDSGRSAAALRAAVAGPHRDLFDFEAMSRLLVAPSRAPGMTARRRDRIAGALRTLASERFFGGAPSRYLLAFGSVEEARTAYGSLAREMADVVRAAAIAELEAEGRYVDGEHDAVFAAFGPGSLSPADLALFPPPLVRIAAEAGGRAARAEVLDALAGTAPVKILLETGDAFGADARLAAAAVALGGAYVVQCAAADLARGAPDVGAALEHRGPALIAVLTGVVPGDDAPPPYLVSAAAAASRAFPRFRYDPALGRAERFALGAHEQPGTLWPEHALEHAGDGGERVALTVRFTAADAALCDPRWSRHFAEVPRSRWDGIVDVPSAQGGAAGAPAGVYAVDRASRLHRLVVDERVLDLARRTADAWERLRELDHASRPAPAPPAAPAAAVAAPAPAEPAQAEPAAEPAPAAGDEAYIETPRCTSCNECTLLNPRMFSYNENKQAFIKDLAAGTYRELVEAAESCQVAIIHPGAPHDPSEPGLAELLERAAAFR
ncbi:MAG TPA: ferredoxin [Candidatus Limnocylindria bacterium]|nr:ferredoxin [Candidatus Limnocylindria bacterium]